MKIALALTGHLRADPIKCINNSIDYLKQYSNNIDVFINTYETLGLHTSVKDYKTIENSYTNDLNNASIFIEQIKESLKPTYFKINNFDSFQNDYVLPKSKNLIDKIISENNGPNLKNVGLLTGIIAQSLQKSILLSEITNIKKNKYDLILLTRPDVNLKGLKRVNISDKLYYVQTQPYYNQNRQVYIHNNKFAYQISKQLFIGFKKVDLVGDLIYFGKLNVIEDFYKYFLKNIEDSIYEAYKSSPNYMNYTIGYSSKSLPNWEMPEYIIASRLLKSKLKYEKLASFDLHINDSVRQFKLHKNL